MVLAPRVVHPEHRGGPRIRARGEEVQWGAEMTSELIENPYYVPPVGPRFYVLSVSEGRIYIVARRQGMHKALFEADFSVAEREVALAFLDEELKQETWRSIAEGKEVV